MMVSVSLAFLSTPSARRATCQLGRIVDSAVISIHALREEGDDEQFVLLLSHGISIHALREEGDSNFLLSENSADDISIHALREEGDSHAHSHSGWSHHFYPRPPRGGRPQLPAPFCREQAISIHALREEGDIGGPYMYIYCEISIHALREEGDPPQAAPSQKGCDFYPRPPRGGRQPAPPAVVQIVVFLSTPSARRATLYGVGSIPCSSYFYPRPPRGGRHLYRYCKRYDIKFLSTPSARRATLQQRRLQQRQLISIHALREEGDIKRGRFCRFHHDFYPRPPRGGRPPEELGRRTEAEFLSTPSARRAT